MPEVTVVGGGLAGAEASLQLASRGIKVALIEMRPEVMTPAHRSSGLAELVCSNSLKSDTSSTASGLLKDELRVLGCRLLGIASRASVPAGHALAVDRDVFSRLVTEEIEAEPLIDISRREQKDLDIEGTVVIATGPLTSTDLSKSLIDHLGGRNLHFYDAIAISVDGRTIDDSVPFRASRYGKGGADYLNIPFDQQRYEALADFLLSAPRAGIRDFEDGACFDACLPVETIVERGMDALRFGPMKPRGLTDPRTGKEPWAVLQLRQEKLDGSILGLVGFQTRLTRKAQKEMLALIPGLENAKIERWGAIHRNTFLDSPRLLDRQQMSRRRDGLFFAGQLAGVEGYVESIAHGLVTALVITSRINGIGMEQLPAETMTGSLVAYLGEEREGFQPMNANMGLLPPVRASRRERKTIKARRALQGLEAWAASNSAVLERSR